MNELRAWIISARRVLQYFAMRIGIGNCPPFDDIYPEGEIVFRRLWRWKRRMRILGAHNVPEPPVVFASNHIRFDDPIVMWMAVSAATNHAYYPRFMMRTGAFEGGTILKSWILDVDELATLVAAIQIDRDRPTLRQLKPFVERLRSKQAFGIYISRTRSRSGYMMEYRDFDEPGSASFFMVQAQQRKDDLKVAAVPLCRTFNPVTKHSTFAFGKPHHIGADAGRDAQRAFDFMLVEEIVALVEINVPQIFALLLYFHALHSLGDHVTINALRMRVYRVISAIRDRHVDPAARTDLAAEFERALRYFTKRQIIAHDQGDAVLATPTILANPPLTRNYHRTNPVKFLANQLMHFPDIIEAAEKATLS